MISFVVVLPLDPVTPMRVTGRKLRIRAPGEILKGGKGIRHGHDAKPVRPGKGRQFCAAAQRLRVRDERCRP